MEKILEVKGFVTVVHDVPFVVKDRVVFIEVNTGRKLGVGIGAPRFAKESPCANIVETVLPVQFEPFGEYANEFVSAVPVTIQFDDENDIPRILDIIVDIFVLDHVNPSEDLAISRPPPANHSRPFQATALAVVKIVDPRPVQLVPFAE
jgi:hypothetical protein